MIRRRYFLLLIVLFVGTALWAVAEPTAEELEVRRRLEEFRKHPEQLARLRENLQGYLRLPEMRREAITKLDREMRELPAKKQERLWIVLERYAEWLEELRQKNPQAYQAVKDAPDAAKRLALIQDRRDREWMDLQPKTQRDRWDALKGEARVKFFTELRQEERQRHAQWVVAKRFWNQLESKPPTPMPSRLSDFFYYKTDKSGKVEKVERVKRYVEEYLMPFLTPQEKKQLADAAGDWPDFPQALVEIASERPSALLGAKNPPRKYKDLPEPVRRRLEKKDKFGSPVKKKLLNEIERYEGPSFASKVVEIAGRENKLPFNHEFWASIDKSLLPPMQDFVANKLHRAIDQAEKRKLADSMGKWPDYPLMIQELSQKHNLQPPWHFLPEPNRWKWDLYRNSKARSWAPEVAKEKKDP
jgi:hypothetical protein